MLRREAASARRATMRAVRRQILETVVAVVGLALLVALLGFVAKEWYDSRLPSTYSVMDYGHARLRRRSAADESRGPSARDGRQRRRPARPDNRRPGRPLRAHRALGGHPARVGTGRARAHLQRQVPGPELRVHDGDLVEVVLAQRGRGGRRHDPLARRRRAERGGRRRRRDAGRGAARARATPTASGSSRPGRSGTTRTRSPPRRSSAGSSASSSASREEPSSALVRPLTRGPLVRRDPDARRKRRPDPGERASPAAPSGSGSSTRTAPSTASRSTARPSASSRSTATT